MSALERREFVASTLSVLRGGGFADCSSRAHAKRLLHLWFFGVGNRVII